MADDRHRVAPLAELGRLHPLAGKGDGLLIGPLGNRHALQADVDAGMVHHGEHGRHAPVLLADQIADAGVLVAERHHAGGAGMDAQLVLQRHAAHVVAHARAAVLTDQELGHDEQRDALGAGRRAGGAGQHQMDDVVGQVVFAVGDEDLGALEAPGAVVGGLGLGFQRAHVRAGLRLGQVHGARPFAGDHPGQIGRLQLVRAMGGDRLHRALVEHGAQREGHVGRRPHLLHGHAQRERQPLPAIVGREGQAVPAAVHILPVGVLETVRRAHRAVIQHRALLVADAVERCDRTGRQLARLVQHRIQQIGRDLGEAVDPAQIVEIAHGVEHEAHIADGGRIGRHFEGLP